MGNLIVLAVPNKALKNTLFSRIIAYLDGCVYTVRIELYR